MGRPALVHVPPFWRKCRIDHVHQPDRYEHFSDSRARSFEEERGSGNQTARRLARVGLRDIPGCLLCWSVE